MSEIDSQKNDILGVGDPNDPSSLAFLRDVKLLVSVDLGQTEITIARFLNLKKGSIIVLDKLAEEPMDVRCNGRLIARGEAVIVNEKFGIRITQINSPDGEEIL